MFRSILPFVLALAANTALAQAWPIKPVRAGANGNVAADLVAKQSADGYTVLASADALPSSAHLYKPNYDPMKDLVPVIQFMRQPLVLAVHPSLSVSTVGELVALAKTTAARSPSLPEVPAGTPADIVKRLNTATDRILALPAVRERFAPQGLEAVGGSPEQFAKLYRDDYEKYGRLVKELNIKID